MTRIGSIAKGHPVYADEGDAEAVAFAKEYIGAHRGGWKVASDIRPIDVRREEAFRTAWRSEATRHGFGGSGTVIYTHRDSGARYEVDVTAGTGDFWSSNYRVTRMESAR